nr:unnamed protein product [Digitaria exilis]
MALGRPGDDHGDPPGKKRAWGGEEKGLTLERRCSRCRRGGGSRYSRVVAAARRDYVDVLLLRASPWNGRSRCVGTAPTPSWLGGCEALLLAAAPSSSSPSPLLPPLTGRLAAGGEASVGGGFK